MSFIARHVLMARRISLQVWVIINTKLFNMNFSQGHRKGTGHMCSVILCALAFALYLQYADQWADLISNGMIDALDHMNAWLSWQYQPSELYS